MNVTLRPAHRTDEAALWEMLHLAVYVPPEGSPLPKEALAQPNLARYVTGWGRDGDHGVVAVELSAAVIGAAWLRVWPANDRGYGFIDCETPELSMAVRPEYRGRGLGTRLLAHLLERADQTYRSVSLSVSVGNPAIRLYHCFGFVPVATDDVAITMRRQRRARSPS